MKTRRFYLATFSIALLFLFTSCGLLVRSMAMKRTTVEKGAIPPDFGKDETILLCVLSGRKFFDKGMKKIVSKEYHGPYEFVTEEELDSDKYKDKSIYRYTIQLRVKTNTKFDYNSPTPGNIPRKSYVPTTTYFMTDRSEKQFGKYSPNLTSGYTRRLLQAYMRNLEALRLENL